MTAQASVIITHNKVEIAYDEKSNRWLFELRGRSRSAESLAKAKEYIDKPVTEKEESTFKPVDIWVGARFGREFEKAKATSVAERSYDSDYLWVVREECKTRSKERASECFPRDEANTRNVEKWLELEKQKDALREQQEKITESLKPIKI